MVMAGGNWAASAERGTIAMPSPASTSPSDVVRWSI